MNIGGSQINFTMGSGSKKDYILAGVLGVVIVAALSVAGYFAFFSGEEGGAIDTTVRMGCINKGCGNEMALDHASLDEGQAMNYKAGQLKIKCDKCGKLSCYQQELCPACNKHFVPESAYNMNSGEAICTHCKADVAALQRKAWMERVK